MKVRINATGDTIVMKFVRPSPDVKLEGYILGYGSSMFSKQFIQLPENGQPYETEMGKMDRRVREKKTCICYISYMSFSLLCHVFAPESHTCFHPNYTET